MGRRTHKKQNGILKAIVVCAAAVILLTAGVFVYKGIIHPEGAVPGVTNGLDAQVCYHDIKLTWEPADKADGYFIYAADADGDEAEFAKIGEVTDTMNCEYSVEEYTHDHMYQFKVTAYGYNPLTKNKTEGEPSQPVTAGYDSSRYAQKIPVLTYHELIPAGYEVHSSLTVREDMFKEQMDYLKDNGFRTLTLDEFYEWYQGKLELPVKSCVITFDDGADNVYYLGYPILKENDQAATVFCIGHHLEENGGVTAPYTPEDGVQRRFCKDVLEKVRAEYPKLAMESHTYNMHKRINGYKPVNVLTYEQMLEDCSLNEPYDFHYMAYPWGAYNKKLKRALKNSGYKIAFGYEPFRYARRTDDPYAISRIKVSGVSDMAAFIETVNGDRPDDPDVVD